MISKFKLLMLFQCAFLITTCWAMAEPEVVVSNKEVEEYQQKYPNLFNNIPENFHKSVIYYTVHKFPNKVRDGINSMLKTIHSFNSIEECFNATNDLSQEIGRSAKRGISWSAIAATYASKIPGIDKNNFEDSGSANFAQKTLRSIASRNGGYWFGLITPALLGSRHLINYYAGEGILRGTYDDPSCSLLLGDYKIHLMPKGDMIPELIKLLDAVINDQTLQKNIDHMKFICNFNDQEMDRQYKDGLKVPPKIVIYPPSGKQQAQALLDKICELFKGSDGLDIIPRYNKKVTSLIYYSQGNSDDKIPNEIFPENTTFFEQPDMVHYTRTLKISKFLSSDEEEEKTFDFHLKVPLEDTQKSSTETSLGNRLGSLKESLQKLSTCFVNLKEKLEALRQSFGKKITSS